VKVALEALGENGWAPPDVVLAMVAELRAAREVVLLGKQFAHTGAIEWDDLEDALTAYDQAVGGGV
jgi:hypothetical protein